MASCPECAATIEIEDDEVEEGQILECPECNAKLEVVNTHPLELDVIPEEDEDEAEV
jgi:alpha-aminoadipate/glutamate carrier protein LysW